MKFEIKKEGKRRWFAWYPVIARDHIGYGQKHYWVWLRFITRNRLSYVHEWEYTLGD